MAFTFGNVTESTSKTPTHNNNGVDVYVFSVYPLGTAPDNEDVTYGGITGHFICEYADLYNHGTLWVCLNAPTGSNTCNVSDSQYNASTPTVILVSVTGAKQSVPTSYDGQIIALGSSSDVDVVSAVGHKVLDFIKANTGSLVVGAGQTQIHNVGSYGASHEDGAASVDMAWTFGGGARGVQIGVDLPSDDGTIVTYPTVPWVGTSGSGTSSPLSFNCNGDILLVAVFDGEGSLGTVSGVTFNGVAMTSLGSYNDTYWLVHVWYLLNPPKGVAYNIAVTMGSGTLAKIEAASIVNSAIVAPTIYSLYAGLSNAPENHLDCTTEYLVVDMIWGRAATRTPVSGQLVKITDEIAQKRGAVDYWSRFSCSSDRFALATVAFRGLGGRTLQIPSLIG